MEHLIQMVHDHPVLYDPSNEDYMRGKMKDEIWERIAEELNYTSGQMAKVQWKKLRDCYRDALRRQSKKKSCQGASVVRPWIYQKQMAFLIPFMNNRNTLSSLTDAEGAGSEIQGDVDEDVDGNLEGTFRDNEPSVSVTDLEEQANSEESPTLNRGKISKRRPNDLNEVMMKSIDNYEKRAKSRDELRESMFENKGNDTSDPLYHFFMSMYNTTKNLPLSHQLRVKRKVFEAVTEAEEELLACNMNSGQSSWVLTSGP